MSDALPEKYLAGLRLFNEEDFFECHEVLEELWGETIGEERLFYQGLIQAAVALFHFGNGNLGGARKLYYASRDKLTPYAPAYLSLDVARLLGDMQTCFQSLIDAGETYPKDVELQDELVPKAWWTDGTQAAT